MDKTVKPWKKYYGFITKIFIIIIVVFLLVLLLDYKPSSNNIIIDIYLYVICVSIGVMLLLVPIIMRRQATSEMESKLTILSYEAADFFCFFAIACLLIQSFFVFGYCRHPIKGDSMYPTFESGDMVITKSISTLDNFDIVVAMYDENKNIPNYNVTNGELLIKRLIGKGGDEVEYIDGVLFVNGIAFEEEYDLYKYTRFSLEEAYKDNYKGIIFDKEKNKYYIEDGYYLLLGDNRMLYNRYTPLSIDSRSLGLFDKSQIVGEVVYKVNSFFDWERVEK